MQRLTTILALLNLAGCIDLAGDVSRDEVAWAKSPDGRVHAILIETNGGATTSYGYVVELHPADHKGEKAVSAGTFYGAVRSDCAYGIDLHWIDATTLALQLDNAKKIDVPESVVVAGEPIRIVVRTGLKNDAAPCGGMLASRGRSTPSKQ